MRSAARLLLALIALNAIAAMNACGDGARDARFRGELLGRISGLQLASRNEGDVFIGDEGHLRGGILWSTPDGESLLDESGVLTMRLEGSFDLDVYAPPPDRFVVRGGVALGQVVFYADLDDDQRRGESDPWLGRSDRLVAFAVEPASGPLTPDALAPGFHLVRPSAPCDVAPLTLFVARPDDPLEVRMRETPAAELFADPGCVAALGEAPDCESLAGVRWWCRHGPATGALCDRCEPLLFPEGADGAACDAWYASCAMRPETREPTCWSEWRVCMSEAPRATRPEE